ncbi:unnamed protein product [Angiostrongylus costaricensis]|uniref:Bestrophin homolog n=1 Tax=Angiostrongylus costaricensis TaxID=334426 RepID=A0A0R3PEP2_ANGCS|nr:unnamed protein product [Angiostrongylus costaricensis]
MNLLHTKFSRAYWLPGRMYMPLRLVYQFSQISIKNILQMTYYDKNNREVKKN